MSCLDPATRAREGESMGSEQARASPAWAKASPPGMAPPLRVNLRAHSMTCACCNRTVHIPREDGTAPRFGRSIPSLRALARNFGDYGSRVRESFPLRDIFTSSIRACLPRCGIHAERRRT
jgi:hypothetical protein